MTILWLILIVPGFACLYALILRPLLHKIPALATFYAEADGFWAKVWAYCGNSLTIAWSYILGGIGSLFALIDKLGPLVGDPDLNLKQQVQDGLQGNPKIAGYVLIGISLLTIITRLRSIGKAS